MELFDLRAAQGRLHPYFLELITDRHAPKRAVLNDWGDGFPDRDGKFALEFQTTFNSCFWELYLHAALRDLGATFDFGFSAPDFVCSHPLSPLIVEATIASHAAGYQPEWRGDPAAPWTPEVRQAALEYSSVRLANAFSAKLEKYRNGYALLPH